MHLDPMLVGRWIVELGLLSAALGVVLRLVGRRSVAWLTVVSFGVRLALGEGLFFVSLLGLPIERSLQTPGGFWQFATDAPVYHAEGLSAAGVLLGQASSPGSIHRFSWLIGGTYVLFGANPSEILVLNASLAAACVPLAYLASRWSDLPHGAAMLVAGIVGFWPSTFAWSSQLLRDPLQWLAIFGLVASAAFLLRATSRPSTAPPRGLVGASLGALLASGVTAWLRGGYESPAFVLAVTAGAILHVALVGWRTAHSPMDGSADAKASLWQRAVPATLLMLAVVVGSVPAKGNIQDEVSTPRATAASGTSCRPLRGLIGARAFYVQSGGGSLVDESAQFATCWDVLAYAPRALALVFLAPSPPAWLRPGTATGGAARLAGIDAMLLWLLLPGLAVGLAAAVWRPAGATLVLAIYVLVLAFVVGFAVANFGTLFRLRLQVILPATLVGVRGWQIILDQLGALSSQSSRHPRRLEA